MLDTRTNMGIIGDKMGTYTQFQAANAIGDAAKNPNGAGLAGLGVGLGAGTTIGKTFGAALADVHDTPKEKPTNLSQKTCVKCGASIASNVKFCPECGEKQPQAKFCPNCGTKLSDSAKFCPECGEKLS